MPNGFSHLYHLDQSISVLKVVGCIFQFYSNFKSTFCKQTAVPDLVIHCLPMSHKKDARLIRV